MPQLHKSLYQIFVLLLEQGEKVSTIEQVLALAEAEVQANQKKEKA